MKAEQIGVYNHYNRNYRTITEAMWTINSAYRFTSSGGGGVVLSVDLPEGDRQGKWVELDDGARAYVKWEEKLNAYITMRRFTPREMFRLQGWNDEYYERAAFVSTEAQLYAQAGNGITVGVAQKIARELKEAEKEQTIEEKGNGEQQNISQM